MPLTGNARLFSTEIPENLERAPHNHTGGTRKNQPRRVVEARGCR